MDCLKFLMGLRGQRVETPRQSVLFNLSVPQFGLKLFKPSRKLGEFRAGKLLHCFF